jgi:two-component system response regulator AtoC
MTRSTAAIERHPNADAASEIQRLRIEGAASAEATFRTSEIRVGNASYWVTDPLMLKVYELARSIAASDIPVLLTGETGVGKDHVAELVHHWSRRKSFRFVALNCAAIPETLVESELFGYVKGAFTGATRSKPGLLEEADGGTLFLDEIGDLPLHAQAKLLRTSDRGSYRRVGDTRDRVANVRLLAATNKSLVELENGGRFRRDLRFRLSGACLDIPALRQRKQDILALARGFLQRARAAIERPPIELTRQAESGLLEQAWEGNVRELKNLMELVATTCQSPEVDWHELRGHLRGPQTFTRPPMSESRKFRPLAAEIEELERQRIREALAATNGVKVAAARLIDMPVRTFAFKLRRYGLDLDKRAPISSGNPAGRRALADPTECGPACGRGAGRLRAGP